MRSNIKASQRLIVLRRTKTPAFIEPLALEIYSRRFSLIEMQPNIASNVFQGGAAISDVFLV